MTTRIGRHEFLTNLNHNYNKICDILGTQEIPRVFLLDLKKKCARAMTCTVQLLGTLRSNYATATRTSLKREFEFFQSFSQLFLPTYFEKRRRTFLELNSEGPYPSSKREIKFRRFACLCPE